MKRFKIVLNAPVVLSFVAFCFLATLLGELSDGELSVVLFSTYRASFKDPLTYIRLFSHIFGHANWDHVIGNMTYILLLGPMLEEKYTSKTLVEVMAVTAIITGILNTVFFPGVMLLGASGVVFAFMLLASFTSFGEREIPLTFIVVAVVFIGQQVVQGVAIDDNVSQFAHIIGGLIGSLVGYRVNSNAGKEKAEKAKAEKAKSEKTKAEKEEKVEVEEKAE